MKIYPKNSQKGRSMIEMLGVLAIVGVLSAGGIAGYSMAMQSYKTNQLIERMSLLATRIRSLYKGNYLGLNNNNLINSGKVSAADLVNPFGGNVVLDNAADINWFWIKTGDYNLPVETCIDIVTTDWGQQIDQAQVFNSSGSRTATLYPPAELSSATAACSAGNMMVQLRYH